MNEQPSLDATVWEDILLMYHQGTEESSQEWQNEISISNGEGIYFVSIGPQHQEVEGIIVSQSPFDSSVDYMVLVDSRSRIVYSVKETKNKDMLHTTNIAQLVGRELRGYTATKSFLQEGDFTSGARVQEVSDAEARRLYSIGVGLFNLVSRGLGLEKHLGQVIVAEHYKDVKV